MPMRHVCASALLVITAATTTLGACSDCEPIAFEDLVAPCDNDWRAPYWEGFRFDAQDTLDAFVASVGPEDEECRSRAFPEVDFETRTLLVINISGRCHPEITYEVCENPDDGDVELRWTAEPTCGDERSDARLVAVTVPKLDAGARVEFVGEASD